jgi:SAM-dependent methyltransferase
MMAPKESMTRHAYEFERTERLHETRGTEGIVNRLTPVRWRVHQDARINAKVVALAGPLARQFEHPLILGIGVGDGRLLRMIWNEPDVTRVGVDINHDVLTRHVTNEFVPVEGSAHPLPIRAGSVDIVLFGNVLHHLVGQGMVEDAISEAGRVLRPGGYIVALEPSSWSASGLAMNVANRFRLMNRLTGSSNYEFALSPSYLIGLLRHEGSVVTVRGLTYLWSRRLPIWLQRVVDRIEPVLFGSDRAQWLADFVVYVVRKEA